MDNTRKLALAGIMTAFTVMILFGAMIVPNLKLFLYGLSSLPMAVVVMECDKKTGLLFYVASALLCFILLPDKVAALPYIVVLGLYGLIKAVAEGSPNTLTEWLIKIIYFNASLSLYLWLIIKIFIPNISFPIPLWIIIIGAEAIFVAYDFIYSYCVSFYEKSLRPKVNSFYRRR
ncbi:MAG: hypothetical protein Q4C00_00125 [Bacillota bacterium]|nr:hypothetical protein [Bacillota bacterium]